MDSSFQLTSAEEQMINNILRRKFMEKLKLTEASSSQQAMEMDSLNSRTYALEYLAEKQKCEIMREQIDLLMAQNKELIINGFKMITAYRDLKSYYEQCDEAELSFIYDTSDKETFYVWTKEKRQNEKYTEILDKEAKAAQVETDVNRFLEGIQNLQEVSTDINHTVNEVLELPTRTHFKF